MEKLKYVHIEVTKDDLRLLALQRTQNVSDDLQTKGKVEAIRLFAHRGRFAAAGKEGNGKENRVDSRIK